MSDALRALTTTAACALLLTGCGGDSSVATRPDDITTAWKKYFTAEGQPSSWRLLGRATERVQLIDDYLSIDGEISGCEDTRVYWQMGLEWRERKDSEISRFITVYSDDELAGDTTTTAEFDCHL